MNDPDNGEQAKTRLLFLHTHSETRSSGLAGDRRVGDDKGRRKFGDSQSSTCTFFMIAAVGYRTFDVMVLAVTCQAIGHGGVWTKYPISRPVIGGVLISPPDRSNQSHRGG